ncbi:hypothetical protein KVT40_004431 [Elsinoe batatas]|uniref:Uncharacterized protein n=1 Tax=Elsinoe batatas TaxID=2601811 RepID=A0A8K0PIJ2_9PEZI|nr:hypothetical protein KVT40_004431 [Elsinoe batatas]
MLPFNGQAAQGQQYVQQPPLKKHKTAGGAVVTHYPPPPGYVPPPNAQIHPTAWQMTQHMYTPAQQAWMQQYYQQYAQAYQAYPQANAWPQPYGYGQPQFQAQQFPQQQYQVPAPHGYQGQPTSDQQWHSQSPHNGTAAASPQNSLQDMSQGFAKPGPPASATPSQPGQLSRAMSTTSSNAEHNDVSPENQLAHPFDEEDYCRESSYARDGESVDSRFSLGSILHVSAHAVQTVLPATFQEAELELLAPKSRDYEDESISQYFVNHKLPEVELSVRQMEEEWGVVKDDMIFREFPHSNIAEYVTVSEVKANRDRPDPHPEVRYPPPDEPQPARSPTPEVKEEIIVEVQQAPEDHESSSEDDAAMDLSSDNEDEPGEQPEVKLEVDEPENQMDGKHAHTPPTADEQRVLASIKQELQQHDRQHGYGRDQEGSRRTSLGVSGSPMSNSHSHHGTPPMHQEQFQRPSPRRNGSETYRGHNHQGRSHRRFDDRRRSTGPSMQYGPHNVPPPPEAVDYENPWRGPDMMFERRGSDGSDTSQHTIPGGDFEIGDRDRTPQHRPQSRPQQDHSGSGKKRGFDEMDLSNRNRGSRQQDQHEPRRHRYRPKVSEAYSRRW